ncbi:hypothetical protein TNCV_4764331 [Trichonephila clavipes]|nr:hypothetical protein TNCV_4764331 [Trichonephila clavipes]
MEIAERKRRADFGAEDEDIENGVRNPERTNRVGRRKVEVEDRLKAYEGKSKQWRKGGRWKKNERTKSIVKMKRKKNFPMKIWK